MKKLFLIPLFFLYGFLTIQAQDRSDTLHIAHYDLSIDISDFNTQIIKGIAALQIVSKINGLETIDLDLTLATDSVLNDHISLPYTQSGDHLLISLPSALNSNDTANITIHYHGIPTGADFGGFYFFSNNAYNIGVSLYDIPHSFGRAWYPCLDIFTDKATYDFHIETTMDKSAICGGMLNRIDTLDNGHLNWNWELSKPAPSYLTSMAVGNYHLFQDTVHSMSGIIPLQIYVPASYLDKVAGSFANWRRVFHAYEKRYGAYRWDKVGYVGITYLPGAMEHIMNIAYPTTFITGNLTYEALYAHEMSHSWFGNLVTCLRAEEMWLNEGFASYSETLFAEELYPNEDPYSDGGKNTTREMLVQTLKTAFCQDGGYFALNDVPQTATYGVHSYQKGANIVHTLRHYLGDSVYFPAIQQMLETYAFKNINSQGLFDFLSQATGQNLTDFYEGWVNQPGLPHFSIDSIRPTSDGHWRIFIRQRHWHGTALANSNRLEITLFAHNNLRKTFNFQFSGEFGTAEVEWEETPLFGVIDLEEKMCDAILDHNFMFTAPGSQQSSDADFSVMITAMDSEEPFWLRVEENFVAPDGLKFPNHNITRISDEHYWRVIFDETQNQNLNGKLNFRFVSQNECDIDHALFDGYTTDSLILLYRKDPSADWGILESTFYGTESGMIRSSVILAGEYALGIGNRAAATISEKTENENVAISVYPNPAHNAITLHCPDGLRLNKVEIYDFQGRKLDDILLSNESPSIPVNSYANGLYLLKCHTSQGIITKKIVIEKQ